MDRTTGERLERYFHDHGERLKLPAEIHSSIMMAIEEFTDVQIANVLAEREAEVELVRRLQLSVRMFLACFGSNAEWEREKRNAKPITRKDVKAMREALEAFAALKQENNETSKND